jgi:hypothetical protein
MQVKARKKKKMSNGQLHSHELNAEINPAT